jgi:Asp-tRNA(Asn)/Glu-tRNA(Gln) amidotransferase A subunit family amidase
VFFDEPMREGKMKESLERLGRARAAGRLIPAVEYLRAQRVRMMMMMKLAEATANFDVYIVASNTTEAGAVATVVAPMAAAVKAAARRRPQPANRRVRRRRRSATRTWPTSPAIRRSTFRMGLRDTGSPTNVTFFARPFAEMELLALAKAYQDAAGFHLKRPAALDAKAATAAGSSGLGIRDSGLGIRD